jgi:hypothetical protein
VILAALDVRMGSGDNLDSFMRLTGRSCEELGYGTSLTSDELLAANRRRCATSTTRSILIAQNMSRKAFLAEELDCQGTVAKNETRSWQDSSAYTPRSRAYTRRQAVLDLGHLREPHLTTRNTEKVCSTA